MAKKSSKKMPTLPPRIQKMDEKMPIAKPGKGKSKGKKGGY